MEEQGIERLDAEAATDCLEVGGDSNMRMTQPPMTSSGLAPRAEGSVHGEGDLSRRRRVFSAESKSAETKARRQKR